MNLGFSGSDAVAASSRFFLVCLNFLIYEMREKDMIFAATLPAANALNLLLSHLE